MWRGVRSIFQKPIIIVVANCISSVAFHLQKHLNDYYVWKIMVSKSIWKLLSS